MSETEEIVQLITLQISLLRKEYPLLGNLQRTFQNFSFSNDAVCYEVICYLCRIIDSTKSNEFNICPIIDAKTKSQFRFGVSKFISWVNRTFPESGIQKILPSNLVDCSNNVKFIKFLMSLSNFTLQYHLRTNLAVINIPDFKDVDADEKINVLHEKLATSIYSYAMNKLREETVLQEKAAYAKKLEERKREVDEGLSRIVAELKHSCSGLPVEFSCENIQDLETEVNNFHNKLDDWETKIDIKRTNCNEGQLIESLDYWIKILNDINSVENPDMYTIDGKKLYMKLSQEVIKVLKKEKITLFDSNYNLSLRGTFQGTNALINKLACLLENTEFYAWEKCLPSLQTYIKKLTSNNQSKKQNINKLTDEVSLLQARCDKIQVELDATGYEPFKRYSRDVCLSWHPRHSLNSDFMDIVSSPDPDESEWMRYINELKKTNRAETENDYFDDFINSIKFDDEIKKDEKPICSRSSLDNIFGEQTEPQSPMKNFTLNRLMNKGNHKSSTSPLARSVLQKQMHLSELGIEGTPQRKHSKMPLSSSSPVASLSDTWKDMIIDESYTSPVESEHNFSISEILDSIPLESKCEFPNSEDSSDSDFESVANTMGIPKRPSLPPLKSRPSMDALIQRYAVIKSNLKFIQADDLQEE